MSLAERMRLRAHKFCSTTPGITASIVAVMAVLCVGANVAIVTISERHAQASASEYGEHGGSAARRYAESALMLAQAALAIEMLGATMLTVAHCAAVSRDASTAQSSAGLRDALRGAAAARVSVVLDVVASVCLVCAGCAVKNIGALDVGIATLLLAIASTASHAIAAACMCGAACCGDGRNKSGPKRGRSAASPPPSPGFDALQDSIDAVENGQ